MFVLAHMVYTHARTHTHTHTHTRGKGLLVNATILQLFYCFIVMATACREELQQLRQQMSEIEKSLMQQVPLNCTNLEEF